MDQHRHYARLALENVVFVSLILIVLSCSGTKNMTPTVTIKPHNPDLCQHISDQERWGIVIDNPADRGFQRALETPHFITWTKQDAKVDESSLVTGEAHVCLMEQLLDVHFAAKITLFIYPDLEAVKTETGMELLIRRDVMQLHLASSRHLHEVVHCITYLLARHRTVPLLEEGFAEAYGNWSWRPGDPPEKLAIKDWTDEHVDTMTARWLADGLLPELKTVLTDRDFRNYDGPLRGGSYVFAASFVLFLIQEFDTTAFTELLKRICNEDDADTVQAKLLMILGKDLSELEKNWHLSIARSERTAAFERGDGELAKSLDRYLSEHSSIPLH